MYGIILGRTILAVNAFLQIHCTTYSAIIGIIPERLFWQVAIEKSSEMETPIAVRDLAEFNAFHTCKVSVTQCFSRLPFLWVSFPNKPVINLMASMIELAHLEACQSYSTIPTAATSMLQEISPQTRTLRITHQPCELKSPIRYSIQARSFFVTYSATNLQQFVCGYYRNCQIQKGVTTSFNLGE